MAVAAADAAAAIIPLADTAVTVAPAPPVFPAPESPSSRRFSFSRRTSEKLDSTFSPLHFPEPHLIAAHAGGDGLDLSPLDESFMSMLQKIAREGQDYAPVHHPHHQPPLVYQPPPPLAYQPPPLICPPQPQYSAPPAGEPAQFSSPPSSRTYSTTADELLASPALFRQQLEFD